MAHDVFISYAFKDKSLADAVCSRLELNGIRCWMAPRDILPGADWSAAVVDAIKSAQILVLVFSQSANDSSQVKREVERAVSFGNAVIPFRVEDITPSSSLEYFISSAHWLDALTPPVERHIDRLSDAVKGLLGKEGAEEGDDGASLKSIVSQPDAEADKQITGAQRDQSLWRGALVVLGLALVCLTAFYLWRGGPADQVDRSPVSNEHNDEKVSAETVSSRVASPKRDAREGTETQDDYGKHKILFTEYTPEMNFYDSGEATLQKAMTKIAAELSEALTTLKLRLRSSLGLLWPARRPDYKTR